MLTFSSRRIWPTDLYIKKPSMKLNHNQIKSLSQYCGNLSIAWLAAGVIGPYISKASFDQEWKIVSTSLFVAGFSLFLMLRLLKGELK